ncbi:hypothetical protein SASPL_100793 [Salvia splendens]|uniref:CW-type domain-containing protein n=1 Tax=Salvia splendens TaxID=180675 RepID=A0A8X9ABA4_SALSN|nr:hypothetical protein SASPL_100793 [Salvia splendens]
MNLHEHCDMFTETKFGEDICGIKDESFMIDFDLDNGKLSVSPQPYQSSSVAADISSLIMVESEVSGSDLLSAFDSICVAPESNADIFDSVGQAYMPIQCTADGNETSDLGSSDLAVVAEPSIQGDGEANKALVGIDKTSTQSHSLIVYTSSRRRSAHDTKSSQMNELPNSSKCRTALNQSSDFDLRFLPIIRRSRSLSANRARSSVWGDLGTILPDIDQSSVLDKRLGNERKQRLKKGGKGKKEGYKRSDSAPGKDITGFVDTKDNKLGEEVPREFSAPCERNLEKVMPSDISAISAHLKCSDVGTSPDSEVINSIRDVSLCEKGLPDLQDGLILSKPCSNSPVCHTLIPCSNGIKIPNALVLLPREGARAGRELFPMRKKQPPKRTGIETVSMVRNETHLGGTGAFSNGVTGPINTVKSSIDGTREQYDPPRNAWVLCDKCQKWRRIQAALADQIEETNCGWLDIYFVLGLVHYFTLSCAGFGLAEINTDKDFADCSIPQEKSNSDINQELEISDEEDACRTFLKLNQNRSKVAQQSSWTLIKSNLFLHRSRKTQTIDDGIDWSEHMFRLLSLDTVQLYDMPAGNGLPLELVHVVNFVQINSEESYLFWHIFRCGKKGYGLQALEDMPQGQFLIEYVGEVMHYHYLSFKPSGA